MKCFEWSVVVFVGLMAGCAVRSNRPVSNEPVRLTGDFDAVWQAGRSELKRRGFELDIADRRTGVIETGPMTSAQWFEPWREDVVDEEDLLESSLQTVRRRVRLNVVSKDDGTIEVACHATVERQVTEADNVVVSGSVRAAQAFPGSAGRIPGLKDKYRQDEEVGWTVLGNDPALEKSILEQIKKSL